MYREKIRLSVDGACNVVDELDDNLGDEIAWSRFASKDDDTRRAITDMQFATLNGKMAIDDVHDVHELSLVLVDALHLDIVHC